MDALPLPAESLGAAPVRSPPCRNQEWSLSAPSAFPDESASGETRSREYRHTLTRKGNLMDKNALVEAAARRTAETDRQLAAEQVERVVDALFGTVEHPGVIAEGLKRGETVTVLGFGAFQLDDNDRATLRPGQALNEYVSGAVG